MSEPQVLSGIFADRKTSLADLVKAGWDIEHNGYHWWFEKPTEGNERRPERQPVPFWIVQLVSHAERMGASKAKYLIKQAIEGDLPLLGACVPFIEQDHKAGD